MGNQESSQALLDKQVSQAPNYPEWLVTLDRLQKESQTLRDEILDWCNSASLDLDVRKDMSARASSSSVMKKGMEVEQTVEMLEIILDTLSYNKDLFIELREGREEVMARLLAEGGAEPNQTDWLCTLCRVLMVMETAYEQIPSRDEVEEMKDNL